MEMSGPFDADDPAAASQMLQCWNLYRSLLTTYRSLMQLRMMKCTSQVSLERRQHLEADCRFQEMTSSAPSEVLRLWLQSLRVGEYEDSPARIIITETHDAECKDFLALVMTLYPHVGGYGGCGTSPIVTGESACKYTHC
jgi:hypothetical protein